MDKAKLRLFAGASGALFGFTGIVSLAVALVIVLAEAIGFAMAVTIIALIFLAVAAGCFYFFLLPNKAAETELGQLEDAGAHALADLPIDTLKFFVSKRPLTAASIALVMGYALIKDPQTAGRHAQRVFLNLL